MVRVNASVPVPVEFVAEIVRLNVPATVGVPEMRPEAVLRLRPDGNPEAPKLVGELVALI
jgi:hypothetical protein